MFKPTLVSFRAVSFHGENRAQADGAPWSLQLQQDIQLGTSVPTVAGTNVQAAVKINLTATAKNEKVDTQTAEFSGEYEAKFDYAPEVTAEALRLQMNQDEHQYLLVAQAYPLAMTHFRRELQSMGFDARGLPLGLPPYPSAGDIASGLQNHSDEAGEDPRP